MGDNTVNDSKISVVIVAAGSGSRMESEIPKQFLSLSGRPILMRTIEKFSSILPDAELIVVMNRAEFKRWNDLCTEHNCCVDHKIVEGGATRFYSVKNGVNATNKNSDIIMIHDGVRPLIDKTLIENTIKAVSSSGVAIPAVDVIDSLREYYNGESKVVNRSNFKLIQTPQVFESSIIRKSYDVEDNIAFTDDATVAEHSGYRVTMCAGSRNNIKITTPIDIIFGELLLSKE